MQPTCPFCHSFWKKNSQELEDPNTWGILGISRRRSSPLTRIPFQHNQSAAGKLAGTPLMVDTWVAMTEGYSTAQLAEKNTSCISLLDIRPTIIRFLKNRRAVMQYGVHTATIYPWVSAMAILGVFCMFAYTQSPQGCLANTSVLQGRDRGGTSRLRMPWCPAGSTSSCTHQWLPRRLPSMRNKPPEVQCLHHKLSHKVWCKINVVWGHTQQVNLPIGLT